MNCPNVGHSPYIIKSRNCNSEFLNLRPEIFIHCTQDGKYISFWVPNLIDWQELPGTSIKKMYQDLPKKTSVIDRWCLLWLSDREHDSQKEIYFLNLNNTVFSTKVIFSIKPPYRTIKLQSYLQRAFHKHIQLTLTYPLDQLKPNFFREACSDSILGHFLWHILIVWSFIPFSPLT